MVSCSYQNAVPPAWIKWFVNDAIRGIIDRHVIAPIGCHFFWDREVDTWEITLFISRTEVCGGHADGKQAPSGLQIDVAAVIRAFDSTPAIYWQSERMSDDDDLGNHLSFEGIARGYRVWLRILQHAPDWTGPGRLIHARCGSIQDLW